MNYAGTIVLFWFFMASAVTSFICHVIPVRDRQVPTDVREFDESGEES